MTNTALVNYTHKTLKNAAVFSKANQRPTNTSNRLIVCADKLFDILRSLQLNQTQQSIDELTNEILLELVKFASNARDLGYQEESILISQYVICRTLDEYLEERFLQKDTLINSIPLYQTLDANFATALGKMCQIPQIFTDILEFIFILNMLSKQHSHSRDNEQLFKLVQNQRGEIEKKLSNNSSKNSPPHEPNKNREIFNPLLILGSILIIIAAYLGFNYMTQQTAKPLQNEINAQLTSAQTAATTPEKQLS